MTNKHGKAVLFTLAALVFTTFGCGSGGGPKLTPEQKTGATGLCQKASSCGLVSSSQMSECVNQFAGALQIFPDPDKFSACVNAMECSTIEDGDSQALMACLDLNRDSYECAGSSNLTGCDNAGKCASISCPDVCDLMGDYTFDHCGPSNNAEKAKNICWCRQ